MLRMPPATELIELGGVYSQPLGHEASSWDTRKAVQSGLQYCGGLERRGKGAGAAS